MKRQKKWMDFKEARRFVRKLGLKSLREWKKYCASGKNHDGIRADIWAYKEYTNGYDWLGKEKRIRMPFKKARRFVRRLKLSGEKEWKRYCKSGKKPENIPAHPEDYAEYIDLYDWLGTSREKRKYKVRDNFFKKWTHNMSYILGFWFSDGHILKKGIFSISQNTSDKYLLEQMSCKLKTNYPIYDGVNNYGTRYSKISIRSKEIFSDIIRLGGVERKSLVVKFPDIPKKYLPDFIRGAWDGDGTAYYRLSNEGKMQGGASILSGSLCFIKKMHEVLKKNISGLVGHVHYRHVTEIRQLSGEYKKVDNTYYLINFSINDARRLRDFMYGGSPELMLKRKYLIFKSLGPIPAPIKYLPFKKARDYVRKLHLKNAKKWKKFSRSKKLPYNIPRCPYNMYKNAGWKGMYDWLGQKPRFLPFNEARKYAMKTGIKTYEEWMKFAKSKRKPRNIPHSPDCTYKNKGYKGIRHWLGIE